MVGVEASGFVEDLPASVDQTRWCWLLGDRLDTSPTGKLIEQGALRFHQQLLDSNADSTIVRTTAFAGPGNTHMMMMDDNSDQIAARVLSWLRS